MTQESARQRGKDLRRLLGSAAVPLSCRSNHMHRVANISLRTDLYRGLHALRYLIMQPLPCKPW